ncbi:hypothetical protein [Candidatus Vidania fulgoroideorum]
MGFHIKNKKRFKKIKDKFNNIAVGTCFIKYIKKKNIKGFKKKIKSFLKC